MKDMMRNHQLKRYNLFLMLPRLITCYFDRIGSSIREDNIGYCKFDQKGKKKTEEISCFMYKMLADVDTNRDLDLSQTYPVSSDGTIYMSRGRQLWHTLRMRMCYSIKARSNRNHLARLLRSNRKTIQINIDKLRKAQVKIQKFNYNLDLEVREITISAMRKVADITRKFFCFAADSTGKDLLDIMRLSPDVLSNISRISLTPVRLCEVEHELEQEKQVYRKIATKFDSSSEIVNDKTVEMHDKPSKHHSDYLNALEIIEEECSVVNRSRMAKSIARIDEKYESPMFKSQPLVYYKSNSLFESESSESRVLVFTKHTPLRSFTQNRENIQNVEREVFTLDQEDTPDQGIDHIIHGPKVEPDFFYLRIKPDQKEEPVSLDGMEDIEPAYRTKFRVSDCMRKYSGVSNSMLEKMAQGSEIANLKLKISNLESNRSYLKSLILSEYDSKNLQTLCLDFTAYLLSQINQRNYSRSPGFTAEDLIFNASVSESNLVKASMNTGIRAQFKHHSDGVSDSDNHSSGRRVA